MTQVAKLNTNVPATEKTPSIGKSKSSMSIAEQFAGIMNQSTRNFFDSNPDFQSTIRTDDRVPAASKKEPLMNEYSKFGRGNRTIAEEKSKTISAQDYSDKLDTVADEIKNVLKETFGVSEEEMQEAMSTLGLAMTDLLDPKNLIMLAAQVSGSDDMTALLVNDGFQDMMQTITGIISSFMQGENIEPNQFSDMLAELSAVSQTEELPQEAMGTLETTEESVGETSQVLLSEAEAMDAQTLQTTDPQMAGQAEEGQQTKTATVSDGSQIVQSEVALDEAQMQHVQSAKESEVVISDNTENEADLAVTTKDNAQSNAFTGDQADSKQFHENLSHSNDQTMLFSPSQNLAGETVAPRMEQMQPEMPVTMSYYEVEQLMQQVDGLARIFAADQSTTIEMQLNPENLGKLYLSVSEKQGAVTAQITASNEQVKETLQTQLAELHQTLQAQGIKVEAVEVTVATHEFEQNLDGNANAGAQFEQNERQEDQNQSARRNLNLSDAGEIPEDLTEAETLAAQMMRDNGNQVDFSA